MSPIVYVHYDRNKYTQYNSATDAADAYVKSGNRGLLFVEVGLQDEINEAIQRKVEKEDTLKALQASVQ